MVGLVGGYFSVAPRARLQGLYLFRPRPFWWGCRDFLASAKAADLRPARRPYRPLPGLNARADRRGVGEAVNQTVVFAFMLLSRLTASSAPLPGRSGWEPEMPQIGKSPSPRIAA